MKILHRDVSPIYRSRKLLLGGMWGEICEDGRQGRISAAFGVKMNDVVNCDGNLPE